MTNISARKSFSALFLTAFAVMLTSGMFVSIAHAQDDGGDTYAYDGGGDTYSYDGGSNTDTYAYDGGSTNADTYAYDGGSTDNTGDTYSYDGDTGDTYSYDGNCDSSCGGDTYSYDGNTGDTYSFDENCTSCQTEDGVTYSENSTPIYGTENTTYTTESTPMTISAPSSYSTGGYSTGGFSMPSFGSFGGGSSFIPSTPIYQSAPIVQNIPVAYQQQQQQQQQAPVIVQQQPNVTTNTCTNYSCNTTTNIENSGNNTTTVIPVAAAPVTYPAQYTIPTYYNNYQNVSCTISASPNSIQNGQYTYLSWQSYGAISATLTSYGNVAPNGSLSVRPNGSTNYVLTVYGQNGQTATCNTYVSVANNYPSVSLSQIPYTGFDFGTFGDAMYWAMLAAFALSAGYLLVYYKGGMGAFAGSMIPARKTSVSHSVAKVEKKTVAPTPVVAQVIDNSISLNQDKPTPTPVKAVAFELPAFTSVRPTHDSMTIATHNGSPRIVIDRA